MKIGDSIIIGRMGQQPMHLTDTSINPQHGTLRKTGSDTYQIEDNNSSKGIFVFGMRIKRKTIKEDTPIFIGTFKTNVKQLLTDCQNINLEDVWRDYDYNKRKWDRYSMYVNSIRLLTPIITTMLTQVVGQNVIVSATVLVTIMVIAIVVGEKVLEKKNIALATLNTKMQAEYVCPHCHRFLGFIPYKVLKQKKYCQYCGIPLK